MSDGDDHDIVAVTTIEGDIAALTERDQKLAMLWIAVRCSASQFRKIGQRGKGCSDGANCSIGRPMTLLGEKSMKTIKVGVRRSEKIDAATRHFSEIF
jgi:hypothetical protein